MLLHPGSMIVADICGKVIFIISHLLLFEKLEQLLTLSWFISKTEVICWCSQNSVTWIVSLQQESS
jgi:hypothetical protein